MRHVLAGVLMFALVSTFTIAQAQSSDDGAVTLRKDIQDLEKRLDKVERSSAMDRIRFSGDYRFEAHSIRASIPDHYDGMLLQNGLVNTIFYYGATGQLPASPGAVNQFVGQHYADYLYFTNNLTFDQLKGYMAMFPAAMQQQLMGSLLPGALRQGVRRQQLAACTRTGCASRCRRRRRRQRHVRRPAVDVQGVGRLHRRAGVQRSVQQLQHRRQHRRRAELRRPPRRAGLLRLEEHRRAADCTCRSAAVPRPGARR